MRARRRRRSVALAGRRVLITGGSSGIGLACARQVLARGARVFLLGRGEEELAPARDELGAALTQVTDADPADLERTVRTTLLGVLNSAHAALPHDLHGLAGSSPARGSLPRRPSLLVSARDRLSRGRGA